MPNLESPNQTPSRPLRIAVIGECMVELFGTPPHLTQGFAGDTLNTAVYLSRLTRNASCHVDYVTAVGQDPLSEAMLALWQKEGIGCDYVLQLADRYPGLYMISVDAKGERSFQYWRGESAAKQMFEAAGAEANLAALTQFDWIYLSGISLAILPEASRVKLLGTIQQARKNGAKMAFDNNYRPRLWPNAHTACQVYDQFLQECDLALLTLDDERQMRPQENQAAVVQRCQSLGVQEIVIKRGAEPCEVYAGTHHYCIPAHKITRVVDTTAAGDSFSAAYLAARVLGRDMETAARWGHTLAASVIQVAGAIISNQDMPNLNSI